MDMKLEVVVVPVADVERTKRFYGGLRWRLDAIICEPIATPEGSGTSESSVP